MALSNLSVASKKILITRIICCFWLIAKIISWKVWLANRLFPVVPPFDFLLVPSSIHLVLFILSLLVLLALFIFPTKKMLLVSVIVIEVISCLLDQNRWQPWEYQYIFMILALVINYKDEKTALSVISFIIASIYFYSGIGKMNSAFSQRILHILTRHGIFHANNSYLYNFLCYHIGHILGMIELLFSLGLLFKRTRKGAAILLILMHFLILVIFGPFGLNYDLIIWPWNVAMIFFIYVLFISQPTVSIKFPSEKIGWNTLIIILFGILPALNFFGYWDFFLSSSLFSFKPPDMYICIEKAGSSTDLQPFIDINKNRFLCDSGSQIVNVRTWSFQELRVPAYPELRVYKKIRTELLNRYADMRVTFVVLIYSNGRKERIELK